MITTCGRCGGLYEAGSEEQAYEPDRLCRRCFNLKRDMDRKKEFLLEIRMNGPDAGVDVVPFEILLVLARKHFISEEFARSELHIAAEQLFAEEWSLSKDEKTYRVQHGARLGACALWGAVLSGLRDARTSGGAA